MAINFGLANDYNVFVFGDLNMSNTDAEGRVAVGGNATLSSYGVGAGITPLPPANVDPSFVIDGDVNVTAGSNASGNTVINPGSTIITYTMGNPNGQLITGTPIDFAAEGQYLKCASAFWSTLLPNGSGQVIFGQLNLTGTDTALNVFSLDTFPHFFQKAGRLSDPDPLVFALGVKDRHASLSVRRDGETVA